MNASNPGSPDPLSREIDAALEGVNLQEVGEEPSASSGSKGAPGAPKLWRGTIVGVHGDDVIVELGPRMQGVIQVREFDTVPSVGEVHSFALRGQEDGLWLLSLSEAKKLAAWNELAPGAHVKARVSGQNTGGLELKVGPLPAFMPASQVALGREDDLSQFIGQTFECEVLEVDASKKRVVLSRRAVLQSEREAQTKEALGSITAGQVVEGKVTRIEGFGAFVQIAPGVEGLLHVSNMSRKRVENPADVVEVGQEVRVQVLDIQQGGKRIGLGMKQLEADPWDEVASTLRTDQVVDGKVTRIADFGAFCEIAPGLEGLLHVSQLGTDRVRRVSDALKEGQELSVRILNIEPGRKRISLSRLDERGAVLGSEEAVDGSLIDDVVEKSQKELGTNLGSLFQKLRKDTDG